MNTQEKYYYWMKTIPSLGRKKEIAILQLPEGPKRLYDALGKDTGTPEDLDPIFQLHVKEIEQAKQHRKTWDLEKEYERLLEKHIRMTWYGREDYPTRLLDIPDPPSFLFYKGALPPKHLPHVAIIGARECSEYGRYIASELGKAIAKVGGIVVSGMARGIDGLSQMAALSEGMPSLGVLGCGPDICYPRQHQQLYEKLISSGCVLSEYLPGTEPVARLFPARNRIISGLSDYVIVVEAREKSGTLITVDMALEQGRDVYIIPGRLTDSLSTGCNKLVMQGANILWSIEEFTNQLAATLLDMGNPAFLPVSLDSFSPKSDPQAVHNPPQANNVFPSGTEKAGLLSPEENLLLSILDSMPKDVDTIQQAFQAQMSCTLPELLWHLLQLCLKGHAKQVGANYYVKIFR